MIDNDALKLEAGNELDRLIAEKVMGWTEDTSNKFPRWKDKEGNQQWWTTGNYSFRPSTEHSHAWEVFLKIPCNARHTGQIYDGRWGVRFYMDAEQKNIAEGEAETFELAVCRAALYFLEKEKQNES